MSRPLRSTILVLLSLLAMMGSARSQPVAWKRIAQNALNPHHNGTESEFGAIAARGQVILAGWENLVLSTDLGKTWQALPSPLERDQETVSDLDLYDDHTFAILTSWNAYYSSDQGRTWNVIDNQVLSPHSILFDGRPDQVLIDGLPHKTTSSNGRVHSSFGLAPQQILHASDNSLRALVQNQTYADTGLSGWTTQIYSSWDHGFSWQPSQIIAWEGDSYSLITDQSDPDRVCIINEDWAFGGFSKCDHKSDIYLTTDNGQTWQHTYTHPLGPVTDLVGNAASGCSDYFVGSYDNGILRSTDKGLSWQSIGGPSTPVDSRSIVALNDSILFAIDDYGTIWQTDPVSVHDEITCSYPFVDTIGGDAIVKIHVYHSGQPVTAGFTLRYDPIPLEFVRINDERGVDRAITHPDGASTRVEFNTSDSILYAQFEFFPVDSACVHVAIDSITGLTLDANCTLAQGIGTNICSTVGCGRTMLARMVRYGEPRLSILPNPASDHIQLITSRRIKNATVTIHDALGVLRQQIANRPIEEGGLRLDLNNLPTGAYGISVTADGVPMMPLSVMVLR